MRKYDDMTSEEQEAQIRQAETTSAELIALGKAFRTGDKEAARRAYVRAITTPAVSMERYASTTLAAAFLFEYAGLIAKRFTDEKKKLLAELVLMEEGLKTLHALYRDIKGSPHRFIELFGEFTNLTPEQLDEIKLRTSRF